MSEDSCGSSGSMELSPDALSELNGGSPMGGHEPMAFANGFRDSNQPYVELYEGPLQRGFRFRYRCEGPSHGGLQGEHSQRGGKTYPTVKIHNYTGAAKVMVTLVTDERVPRTHAHELMGKHCNNGICLVDVPPASSGNHLTVTFPNLGILHVTKKRVVPILKDRIIESMKTHHMLTGSLQSLPTVITAEQQAEAGRQAEEYAKHMQLNVIRLSFRAYLQDETGGYSRMLDPVISKPVYDSKCPGVAGLNICRMDRHAGCCTGHEEVFLLCDKVQKDDILMRFFENDADGEVKWESYGNFGPSDVHRQYAIVFKTPPYKDLYIKQPVHVMVHLKRISDGQTSEPKPFTYYPKESDKEEVERKRKKALPFSGAGGDHQSGNQRGRGLNHFGGSTGSSDNGSSNGVNSGGAYEGHQYGIGQDFPGFLPSGFDTQPPQNAAAAGSFNPHSPPSILQPHQSNPSSGIHIQQQQQLPFRPNQNQLLMHSGNSSMMQAQTLPHVTLSQIQTLQRTQGIVTQNQQHPGIVNQAQIQPHSGMMVGQSQMQPNTMTMVTQNQLQQQSQPMLAQNQLQQHSPPVVSQNQLQQQSQPMLAQNQLQQHSPPVVSQNQLQQQSQPMLAQNQLQQHSPPMVQQHSPQMVQQHSPQMVQQHSPQMVQQHSPQMVQQHSPQMVQQHSPQMVQQHSPQMVQQHSPQMVQQHSPLMGCQDQMQPSRPMVGQTQLQQHSLPDVSQTAESVTVSQVLQALEDPELLALQVLLQSQVESPCESQVTDFSFLRQSDLLTDGGDVDQALGHDDLRCDGGDVEDDVDADLEEDAVPYECTEDVITTSMPCKGYQKPESVIQERRSSDQDLIEDLQNLKVTDLAPARKESSTAPVAGVQPPSTTIQVKDEKQMQKLVEAAGMDLHPLKLLIQLAERTMKALQNFASTGDVCHVLRIQRHLVTMQNDQGDTALHLAVIHRQPGVLAQLLQAVLTLQSHASIVNLQNLRHCQTALHLAVITQQSDMVSQLLEVKADPAIIDSNGNNALHLAAIHGDWPSLFWMRKSVPPDASGDKLGLDVLNYQGYTPMHLAVLNEHFSCVKELREAGANVDAPDGRSGCTALHHAVEANDHAIAGYLLIESDADVNAMTFSGTTALHVAVGRQLVQMAVLLMAAGADPYKESNELIEVDDLDCEDDERDYVRPIDMAQGNIEMMKALEDVVYPEVPDSLPLHAKKGDMGELDLATRTSISELLDPVSNNRDWQALAEGLGLHSVMNGFRLQPSPTLHVLDAYQTANGTLAHLKEVLINIQRHDAASLVEGVSTVVASPEYRSPLRPEIELMVKRQHLDSERIDSAIGSMSLNSES